MPRFAVTLIGGWVLSALKQFPEPPSGLGRFPFYSYITSVCTKGTSSAETFIFD